MPEAHAAGGQTADGASPFPQEATGESELLAARERMVRVAAARDALAGLSASLWQLSGSQLGEALASVWDVGVLVEAAKVAILHEALDRGEAGAGAATGDWVGTHAGSAGGLVEPGAITSLVAVAQGIRPLAADPSASLEDTRDSRGVLREAVLAGQVSVTKARICLEEMARLEHRLLPGFVVAAWQAYTTLATLGRSIEVRRLRPSLLARYGAPDELQRDHDAAHRLIGLSGPARDGALSEYRLVLDPEGHAVLEAALGPLSAPSAGPDGQRDERPAARRRAEALIQLVSRAVAAGNGTPVSTKAQVFVTIAADDLCPDRGAGEVLGSTAAGTLLPVSAIRRMCCDGVVLPAVLGSEGQLLELGRAIRFFTMAQVRALVLRDRQCTFPGCDTPATWCDAHHLVHWADGGPSGLSNATLLCGRHHAFVHNKRLAGAVGSDGHLVWDLVPGSYDLVLAERRAAASDAAAGDVAAGDAAAGPPGTAAPPDRP